MVILSVWKELQEKPSAKGQILTSTRQLEVVRPEKSGMEVMGEAWFSPVEEAARPHWLSQGTVEPEKAVEPSGAPVVHTAAGMLQIL